MKQPSARTFKLRRKLQALADRGIGGEQGAATRALLKLEARYDFTGPDPGEPLFAGTFTKGARFVPLCGFMPSSLPFASFVGWAVAHGTGIASAWRTEGGSLFLLAEASDDSAVQLSRIAGYLRDSFSELWTAFHKAGARPQDLTHFARGLYDGLMAEPLDGRLPTVRVEAVRAKAKKKAVGLPAGIRKHPYSIGAELGKQIRFNQPSAELQAGLVRQLEAA